MKKMLLIMFVLTMLSSLLAETSVGSLGWDDRGYLVFESEDGNFKTRFDTRFYINGSYFLDDPDEILSNQTNLRKARFAIKTRLWKYWTFEWDIDVAEADLVEVKDMWVAYDGFNNSHLKFGNFKQALGLEEITSSRLLVFPERAYPMMAFETDRQFGLEYSMWGKMSMLPYNLRTSVFTQTLAVEGESDYEKEIDETGNGAALRLVTAPQLNPDIQLHLGVAGVYSLPYDETYEVEFKSEPETKNGDVEFLDTSGIDEVDHVQRYGLEGAFQYKSFHFQSEYIMANVIRQDKSNLEDAYFDGGYAFLAWALTGEKRAWNLNDGEFGQLIPNNNKLGAWEVAVRYSYLNLNDEEASVYGGKANNITLGLNWYPNPNVKFQTSYTMVDQSENADSEGDYDVGKDGYDTNYLQFMTVIFW